MIFRLGGRGGYPLNGKKSLSSFWRLPLQLFLWEPIIHRIALFLILHALKTNVLREKGWLADRICYQAGQGQENLVKTLDYTASFYPLSYFEWEEFGNGASSNFSLQLLIAINKTFGLIIKKDTFQEAKWILKLNFHALLTSLTGRNAGCSVSQKFILASCPDIGWYLVRH